MADSYEIDHKVMDGDLPDESETTLFLLHYQQIILLHESVIDFLSMRFDLINKECRMRGVCSPIRSVSSRIKEPQSIIKKLKKLKAPISIVSMQERLNDILSILVERGRCYYSENEMPEP